MHPLSTVIEFEVSGCSDSIDLGAEGVEEQEVVSSRKDSSFTGEKVTGYSKRDDPLESYKKTKRNEITMLTYPNSS
jgi:hypothetical protein